MTGLDLYLKYGDPTTEEHMVVFDVPAELEVGAIPKKIYCHKDLIIPLRKAISLLITTGHVDELRTWDGCFNIRPIRGYEPRYKELKSSGKTLDAMQLLSIHSWGLAIDVNAAWNALGAKPTLSPGFVKCFTDAGFEWGGSWKRKDGMHFQLAQL